MLLLCCHNSLQSNSSTKLQWQRLHHYYCWCCCQHYQCCRQIIIIIMYSAQIQACSSWRCWCRWVEKWTSREGKQMSFEFFSSSVLSFEGRCYLLIQIQIQIEMTFEGANRWWLPDTEWDGIPNCWSCKGKTEGFTTNGRGGEMNMVVDGRLCEEERRSLEGALRLMRDERYEGESDWRVR